MAGQWEPVSGVFWSTAPLLPSLDWIWNLGNSSFFTTVFGALTGAFFGAWAAQRIAARAKLSDELRNELRSTNAGIMLAITSANLAFALKKQHVKALKESYDSDCKAFEVYRENQQLGKAQPPFTLAPRLDRLDVISPPITALQDIVMGKISTTGRAIISVTALSDAIGNLNGALTARNELLARIKEDRLPTGARIEHFYFGLHYAEGKTNQEFGGYVQALSLYTDDVIFYSVKLCDDLREHGLHVAEKHKKKLGGKLPEVSNFDWRKAEGQDLLPKDEAYESWLSGYQPPSNKKRNWWQRREQPSQAAG